MQGIYNVLLWSRPDVLESICNKAVSVKREGENSASSVRRIIFKILLAFEESPLSQEHNDSMNKLCSMQLLVSLFLLLDAAKAGLFSSAELSGSPFYSTFH